MGNNIKRARYLRKMRLNDLAGALGVTPQTLVKYESNRIQPGAKMLPQLCEVLDVSAAFLRGEEQRLPVRDWETGETLLYPIMREEAIESYGVLYLVDDTGAELSVLMADGVQMTLSDWQGAQVMTAAQIADPPNGHWVDAWGRDAVMLDGLPRVVE